MSQSPLDAEIQGSAPSWLTKSYMQDKLRKFYKDETINVTELVVRPASGKGENYASVMNRLKVSFTTDSQKDECTKMFIIKSSFDSNDRASEVLNAYGIYQREMEMYERILPKLAALLKEINDADKLFAETVHVDYEHNSFILEDLSLSNYIMADRIQRLDADHTMIALRKLAKMHAAAAVLNEREPGIFSKNFDHGMFNRHTKQGMQMFKGMLKALARYLETQSDLKNEYYDKIVKLQDRFLECGIQAFDVNSNHFMTLAHGDLWTNNMMFQYDEKKIPSDVVLIDFQFSTWTSPAVDLHYFLNTSLREELRLHEQPKLLHFYYKILTETLHSLQFKGHIPSLFEFRIQVELRSFLGKSKSLKYILNEY